MALGGGAVEGVLRVEEGVGVVGGLAGVGIVRRDGRHQPEVVVGRKLAAVGAEKILQVVADVGGVAQIGAVDAADLQIAVLNLRQRRVTDVDVAADTLAREECARIEIELLAAAAVFDVRH